VAKLRAGNIEGAKTDWAALVNRVAGRRDRTDVQAVLAWILRQAYLEGIPPLRDAADRVRVTEEARGALLQHVAAVRQQAASLTGTRRLTMPAADVHRFQPGQQTLLAWRQVAMTKGEIDAYLTATARHLDTLGDDAQLANVDLQHVLQKQQQTLQMLGTISKLLHDTAMAVVRKIGG